MTDPREQPAPVCGPECWERITCQQHGVLMPPRGRAEPDGMPTCDHQHQGINTCHLWGPHDSSRSYNDPAGWEQHVDGCQECRQEFRGEEPTSPTIPTQEQPS